MKTLQEIIDRQDYIKMTARLRQRAHEIATKIREKMETLISVWDSREDDIPPYAVILGKVYYCYRYNMYRFNCKLQTDGTVLCAYISPTEWYPLEIQDTHSVYAKETPSHILVDFLNNANEIIQKLDEIETEKVADIEQALNTTENL